MPFLAVLAAGDGPAEVGNSSEAASTGRAASTMGTRLWEDSQCSQSSARPFCVSIDRRTAAESTRSERLAGAENFIIDCDIHHRL